MSFSHETNTEKKYSIPERYKEIDAANKESFYVNNPRRTLDVFQSVQSIGDERIDLSKLTDEELEAAPIARRMIAGGNMSALGPYGPVEFETDAQRIKDAQDNMKAFFESINVPQESAFILNPERDYTTPLTVVDVDAQSLEGHEERPLRLDTSGDFIFTRDPNKILTVRPADCPVMIASADTPEGKIYMLVHYAWKGAANGYVEQTARVFDTLGVDRGSLEIYLTAGGQAESFPYSDYDQDPTTEYPGTEGLFLNREEYINEAGEKKWKFSIDTPRFVYDEVIHQFGVDPKQVFCDTSDTSALDSGYSSHGRSSRLRGQGESNTRDIVIAVFNNGQAPATEANTHE